MVKLLFILLVLAQVLFSHGKPPANKSALFAKYPILSSNQTNPCTRAFSDLLIDFLRPPYAQMT